jgi:hypothetical protein
MSTIVVFSFLETDTILSYSFTLDAVETLSSTAIMSTPPLLLKGASILRPLDLTLNLSLYATDPRSMIAHFAYLLPSPLPASFKSN